MTSMAVTYPGTFTEPNLPKIDLEYQAPLPGAFFDWSAKHMPLGTISRWSDMVSGMSLVADGDPVTVVDSGLTRAVKLTNSRLRAQFTKSGPITAVVAYRLTSPGTGQNMFYGYLDGSSPRMSTSGIPQETIAAVNVSYVRTNPKAMADAKWHIAVATYDGANSSIRVDDSDGTGTMDVSTMDGITLGYGASNTRTPIEIARFALLSATTNALDRAYLVAKLRLDLNI